MIIGTYPTSCGGRPLTAFLIKANNEATDMSKMNKTTTRTQVKMALLCTLIACSTWAQTNKVTISGYVTDAKNGERLPFVNVYEATSQQGVTTNAYGFYSLTLPSGDHELIFSFIGYTLRKEKVSAGENITLSIELNEEASQLEEVVVSGTKDEWLQDNQMSVNKISGTKLKQIPVVFGEPDVVRSLTLLPGVTTVNEAASGFNVRGGMADQNLVVLDEAIVYNTSYAFGFFSVFNPDAVKEFNLYKGGIRAQYGGRISSVLDVRQKEGNSKEFSGAGSVGTIAARLSAEGPLGRVEEGGTAKGSWMVAARRSYADFFLKTGIVPDLQDATLYFYDLNLKTNYKLGEKDHVYLSGYFGRDFFKYPDFFGTRWGNATTTLRWNHLFSSKLFANTIATYSNYDYLLTNYESSNGFDWKSNIINWSAKTDFTYFANNNTFNFGAGALRYQFKPGEISPIGSSQVERETFQNKYAWELSAYADNETKLGDVVLTYGIRYARFLRQGRETIRQYEGGAPTRFNTTTGRIAVADVTDEVAYKSGDEISTDEGWEPRFSLRWAMSEKHSIKASFNRIYQYVHLLSNTTSATPLDIWMPSGPYMQPQRGDQMALGYFTKLKDNAFDFSVEGFYKDMKNLPDYIDGANLLFNDYLETETTAGRGYAYGLEFSLKKETGNFTGWISYTFSRSKRQVNGINNNEWYSSNNDRPHQFNITTSYKVNKRLTLSANAVVSSGTPITYPDGKYEYDGFIVPSYSTRNGNRLPIYHRLDLSATLEGKRKGRWIFGVYNAYNRLNPSTIYFRQRTIVNDSGINNTGETEAVKFGYFGIIPSVTYEFKF